MRNKCSHYFEDEHRQLCYGTKEREKCYCHGDRLKCHFYKSVREDAKKNITIQDAINHFKYGISHNIFSEPVTTYAEMAVEALEKHIAIKTLEKDYVPNGTLIYGHCPKCDTFTDNNEEYCYKCGQKLDWK